MKEDLARYISRVFILRVGNHQAAEEQLHGIVDLAISDRFKAFQAFVIHSIYCFLDNFLMYYFPNPLKLKITQSLFHVRLSSVLFCFHPFQFQLL
jgi:hypothetical protein